MFKITKIFYFCYFKKLVRRENFGPYHLSTTSYKKQISNILQHYASNIYANKEIKMVQSTNATKFNIFQVSLISNK